jgi:hypothetical protein
MTGKPKGTRLRIGTDNALVFLDVRMVGNHKSGAIGRIDSYRATEPLWRFLRGRLRARSS